MTKSNLEQCTQNKITKFDIIRIFDEWRWSQQDTRLDDEIYEFEISTYPFYKTYKLFKENKEELSVELAKKILFAHYLVYICDRQMDYRFVFKYGGYVIAQILEDYIKDFNWKSPSDYEDCFLEFIKKHTARIKKKNTNNDNNGIYSHYLKAAKPDNNLYKNLKKKYDSIKNDYEGEDKDNVVLFASRMTIIDYFCIFRSLENIEQFFNILENKTNIYSIAEGLYNITYKGVKNLSGKNEPNFVEIYKKYKQEIKAIDNKDISFEKKKYDSKRLWCVIRDYMYNPLFKKCFQKVVGKKNFLKLSKHESLEKIELPGDVWNNNLDFARCFWTNVDESAKKINSSKIIRKNYINYKDSWNGCLPIQFDITFNFVPRMCTIGNCNICPLAQFSKINEIKEFGNQWQEIVCHKQAGKYCTMALYATGIKHICKGESNCGLFKL